MFEKICFFKKTKRFFLLASKVVLCRSTYKRIMPALPERCWAGFLLAFFRRRDWKPRTNVVFAMNDIFVLCFTKKWIHSKALQSYLSSFPIRNLLITFKNSKNFVHLIKFFQWQCFKGRNINYKSNYRHAHLR